MFCLRSWLPLLFIPTTASPAFIFLFFVCTYFLNRPCFYCSILLFVLFVTSCNWSDRCFFDFGSNWFQPRPSAPLHSGSSTAPSVVLNGSAATTATAAATAAALEPGRELDLNSTALAMLGTTASALSSAALDELARQGNEWTGLGIEWLRSLLGKREWRIDCLDVYIRL